MAFIMNRKFLGDIKAYVMVIKFRKYVYFFAHCIIYMTLNKKLFSKPSFVNIIKFAGNERIVNLLLYAILQTYCAWIFFDKTNCSEVCIDRNVLHETLEIFWQRNRAQKVSNVCHVSSSHTNSSYKAASRTYLVPKVAP